MRRIPVLVVLVVAAGCGRGGGDDGAVCHDAAGLCGASGNFDEDDCKGDQKAYAECIVDRGDCEPQTLVDCASAGSGADGGVTGGGSIEIAVSSFSWELSLVDVTLDITNVSETAPIAVAPTYFQIEDEAANLHVASGGFCSGGEMLAVGGSEPCDLQFTIGAAAPVSLVYRDGQGRDAEASLEGLCSAQPEVTEAACSDGCSNDDDDFIDCDDYDCCDVVDCPSTTTCGQEQECVEGPEDTAEACSDGCSNDADSFVDCEDYDCCDVVACGPGTACGDR